MAITKDYTRTRVTNLSGGTRHFSWLGDNGRELAANGTYDHEGVLPDGLGPIELDQYNDDIRAGTCSVVLLPAPHGGNWSSPPVILSKSFGSGVTGNLMFNANFPGKVRIINGWVNISAEGADHNTAGCSIRATIDSAGATALTSYYDITNLGLANDNLRFSEIIYDKSLLLTGATINVNLTGVSATGGTYGQTGTLYLIAIPE